MLTKNTWNMIRKFWNYPRVKPPKVLTQNDAIKQGIGNEIAAIKMDNNEILVNEVNLEKKVGSNNIGHIVSHEVGHYSYMPFNLKTLVRLVAYADKVTRNLKHAQLAENLYADLCVNTKAFRKGQKGLVGVYRRLSQGKVSKLWQLYATAFENLTNSQGIIIPRATEEVRIKAKKLSDIVNNSMNKSNKWPTAMTDFAKIVKEYIREEGKGGDDGKPKSKNVSDGLIDKHVAKDFIPYKGPQKDAQVQKDLKGLAKELGKKEFKRVVSGLGIVPRVKADKWFYKDLAKDHTIFLPQVAARSAGSYKETPLKWSIGDDVAEIDVPYSMMHSPIMIPEVTTYKWKMASAENYGSGTNTPDLLIVLDSSLSMPNPKTDLSFPVLSAMIAAESARSYGNKVAVVNFSTEYESCDFTDQSEIIEDLIMLYLNDSTIIPGEEMVRLTKKHNYPTHTIIISDTDIHNLYDQTENLEKTLKYSKAGGSIFICCDPDDKTRFLQNMGYNVNIARNFSELGQLTIEKSKEIYSPV